MSLLKIMKLQKSLNEKPWSDEDKEIVGKLISLYRKSRKQPTLQDAIEIINKRRMQNSMFIGAEMDFLDEPDDLIVRVQHETKQLYKAQTILENIESNSKRAKGEN